MFKYIADTLNQWLEIILWNYRQLLNANFACDVRLKAASVTMVNLYAEDV